jgi:hypothetical protein
MHYHIFVKSTFEPENLFHFVLRQDELETLKDRLGTYRSTEIYKAPVTEEFLRHTKLESGQALLLNFLRSDGEASCAGISPEVGSDWQAGTILQFIKYVQVRYAEDFSASQRYHLQNLHTLFNYRCYFYQFRCVSHTSQETPCNSSRPQPNYIS